MPTGGRRASEVLVDTSAAVPLVVAGHRDHAATFAALKGRSLGLSGHAAFETFSVLTRLPSPARRTPAVVARLLRATFPETRFLSASGAASLADRLESLGIAGGSVHDALVGATAAEHGLKLVTRDRRATETYGLLGIEVEVLG